MWLRHTLCSQPYGRKITDGFFEDLSSSETGLYRYVIVRNIVHCILNTRWDQNRYTGHLIEHARIFFREDA
jgi:hypothetical protein